MNDSLPMRGVRLGRRLFFRIATSVLVTLLAAYIVYAWPYFTRAPVITRHAAADFNADLLADPPQDLAWAEIHRGRALQPEIIDEVYRNLSGSLLTPESKDWDLLASMLDRQEEVFAIISAAASRPRLGCFISDVELQATPGRLDGGWTASYPPPPGGADPVLFTSSMGWLGELRSLARDYAMRMILSAQRGQPDKVLADALTLFDLARLAEDPPFTMSQLVRAAMLALTVDRVSYVVAAYPGLLRDDDLTSLQTALRISLAESLFWDDSWERATMLDIWQREFSDDGAGDGTMTFQGMQFMDQSVRGVAPETWENLTLGPFAARAYGSRRDAESILDSMLEAVYQDSLTMPWERLEASSDAWTQEIEARKHSPIERMMTAVQPALLRAVRALPTVRGHCEAAIVWLALERHRLANGDYPADSSALVPALAPFGVEQMPIDIFSGGELLYAHVLDGCVLYSVGTDGDDDQAQRTREPFDAQSFHPQERLERFLRETPERWDGDLVYWPPTATVDGEKVVREVGARRLSVRR